MWLMLSGIRPACFAVGMAALLPDNKDYASEQIPAHLMRLTECPHRGQMGSPEKNVALRAGNAGNRGSVRALERGLAVLAAMNRHKIASVLELARETRLPRPTVYRLLETLGRAGYVTRAGSA